VVENKLSAPATSAEKLAVPVVVGVPLITPALLKLKPGGRVPEKRALRVFPLDFLRGFEE
jgi:hypothetical protein